MSWASLKFTSAYISKVKSHLTLLLRAVIKIVLFSFDKIFMNKFFGLELYLLFIQMLIKGINLSFTCNVK